MTLRSLALCSAALIALSGAALAADPEEQAVTRELNAQQLETPSIVQTGASPRAMAPTPAVTGGAALDEIANPAATLNHRVVQSRAGVPIGTVQHVVLDDGQAVAVDVKLDADGRMVTIDADELFYDESGDVLVTDMSMSEIGDLPSI